jgi:glutaminyl-tRNA synthetase
VLSKRRLLELVESGLVSGWDDPRMPTISGFRRRGFTPESIANFADIIGVAKDNSIVDMPLLEMCVRENLNRSAPRVMAVLRPLKVVITNYPEGKVEEFDAVNNPEDASAGARKIPFSRELWIERDDFMENPPPKFYRLSPGREVRLRYAYFIKCEEVVKDAAGNVVELRCTYDPATRGGDTPPDGRKVKATLHWVSAAQAIDAEVRLYDTLFTVRDPGSVAEGVDWKATLNPKSVDIVKVAKLEPGLASAVPESRWQFERLGYFCADRRDSKPGALVFNRTVTLRDEWARIVKAGKDAS